MLFGQSFPLDADLLRSEMVSRRTSPERQIALWNDLFRQWPDPFWGKVCLEEARRMSSVLEGWRNLDAELASSAPPLSSPLSRSPEPAAVDAPTLPPSHFIWIGNDCGITIDTVRGGIEAMSRLGLIQSDRAQQDALRRGLGISVNKDERTSDPPPVRWLGPVDMLSLLINELWDEKLITCAGGKQKKWRTTCSVFRRDDGSKFNLTIKNSHCTDTKKIALLEKAFLGALRHRA